MFGNVAASAMTQPQLGPPQVANDAPLRVAYRDPLIGPGGWPSVAAAYAFGRDGGGAAALTLTFHFDPSSYTPTGPLPPPTRDPNDVPTWQQRALADAVTYRQIARQLSAPRVSASVATTLDGATAHALDVRPFAAFATAAAAYLDALAARPDSPPTPPTAPTVSLPVAATNAEDLFALRVELTLARAAADVDDAFRGGAAERLVTPLAPQIDAGADGAHALTAFAQALEDAYAAAPVFLKVASGQSQRETADADSIWIVRLRTAPGRAGDPGIAIAIDGAARYYAPRPLANVLLSRSDVPLLAFDPQSGVDWDRPTTTAFTSVALDTWGRQALAALDRFLSPDFASATFLLDHVDPARAELLSGMLDVKQRLAQAIAGTLQPILTQPPLPDGDGRPLADAVETMRQQLLTRAENAYVVTAICQYGATVASPWQDDPDRGVYAPRLYGPLDVARRDARGGDDEPPQPWSFTVARPKLAPGAAFVSSALTVVDPAAQTSLPLTLDFALSNIEHEIERGIDGDYLASSWLSLVIPFSAQAPGAPSVDLSIGDVDVPVVLREVPTPPTLRAQEADPQPADEGDAATRLAHAKAWRYGFTYEKDVIAQDTIDASVLFNLAEDDPNLRLAARDLDLFDHLARFVAIWPQLLPVLVDVLVPDRLDLDPASAGYRRAHRLVADLLRLLKPLPDAWAAWHAQPQERRLLTALTTGQSSRLDFSIAERRAEPDVLQAIRTPGEQTATIWDPSAGRVVPLPPPALTIDDGEIVWTARPVRDAPNTFEYADRDGNVLSWTRASTSLRQRTPLFEGLGDGLDVAAFENAWSALRVLRNRDLVRGPDGRVIPTTPVFVYQTPEIKFASRVTPRLQRDGEIDVAGLSSPPQQTLVRHLQRLADALLGNATGVRLLVRLDVEFGQTIAPGLPPAVVPIVLGSPTELTAAGAPAFVAAVAGFVVDWFSDQTPGDGSLRFTVTLFPTLSASRVPLLQLTALTLRRADVSDLQPPR